MRYKVLIAEDERLAREELAYQLQQEEDFLVVPSAENGRQLLDLYEKYQPAVIFLDVQMPGLSGIDAAMQLIVRNDEKNRVQPLFVFITAYEEYALQAFGIEAVDYLLKPYGADRLKETVSRLRRRLQRPSAAVRAAKLLIEENEKVVVVDPAQVIYASRDDRLIEVITTVGRIRTKMTLQEFEDQLTDFAFFRPHRSYLVNLDFVQEIVPWFNGAYNLILKHDPSVKIPVSRSAAKLLFDRLRA